MAMMMMMTTTTTTMVTSDCGCDKWADCATLRVTSCNEAPQRVAHNYKAGTN